MEKSDAGRSQVIVLHMLPRWHPRLWPLYLRQLRLWVQR